MRSEVFFVLTFSESSTVPLAKDSSLSFSMKGTRWATAFFITLADLITWKTTVCRLNCVLVGAPINEPSTYGKNDCCCFSGQLIK